VATPRRTEPRQHSIWYGDVRHAALHVLRLRQPELARLGQACGAGSVEAKLSDLVGEAVESGVVLPVGRMRVLAEIRETLDSRSAYFHVRRLWRIAELIEEAVSAEA
jgi:hypothetical protein